MGELARPKGNSWRYYTEVLPNFQNWTEEWGRLRSSIPGLHGVYFTVYPLGMSPVGIPFPPEGKGALGLGSGRTRIHDRGRHKDKQAGDFGIGLAASERNANQGQPSQQGNTPF